MEEAMRELRAVEGVSVLSQPIQECFSWAQLFRTHRGCFSTKLFVVAFRSVRREDADVALLLRADAIAHQEAKRSGGLLLYLGGAVNSKRECISTCVWESREAAERANTLPAHVEATKLVARMYECFVLEKYWLTVSPHDALPLFQLIHWVGNPGIISIPKPITSLDHQFCQSCKEVLVLDAP